MKEAYLPALRGHLGDWIYYVTLMKMKDIVERIKFAKEIYHSETLNDLIQRDVLPERSKAISNYLRTNSQRFFNSLTVGVFGGVPQWIELSINEKYIGESLPDIPLSEQGIIGYLKLDGSELLFPIDGQHRVAGIKEALEDCMADKSNFDNKLMNEEISVIFIGHKHTQEGIKRIRRLFTTLNRYAKPVSLKDIIALDEDDIVAIITRELIENHKLFSGNNISLTLGSSINPKDRRSFTNIVTLYKCNDLFCLMYFKQKSSINWTGFKRIRPEEEIVQDCMGFIFLLWEKFINTFNIIKKYTQDIEFDSDKDFPYRNPEGGHSFFRPIGLLTYARVLYHAALAGHKYESTLEKLAKIDTDLFAIPWNGVIWESGSKRMIVRDINQKTIVRLIYYMLGFDLKDLKRTKTQLHAEYASLLNKEVKDVDLPPIVK